jgi:hypothetical protein
VVEDHLGDIKSTPFGDAWFENLVLELWISVVYNNIELGVKKLGFNLSVTFQNERISPVKVITSVKHLSL